MAATIEVVYKSIMSARAAKVNAPATIRVRQEAGPTVAGHFDCGPRYRVRRPGRGDLLLIVSLGGSGVLRDGGDEVKVPAGRAAAYLPETRQDYGTDPAAGRWRFRWCHATPRPGWWPSLRWPGPWEGVGVVDLDDPTARREAAAALRRAAGAASLPGPLAQAVATNAAEAAVLWCGSRSPAAGPAVDVRVRAACDHARRNHLRRVPVAEMAAAAGISVVRLTALFRGQLRTSPARYAESLRLAHAARLLSTAGLSVKEAAAACGFDDPAHFSRRFSAHFGHPPSRRALAD